MFSLLHFVGSLFAGAQASKAAYFLENDPAGANIVSLKLEQGILSNPVRISTGGKGGLSINSTGSPATADSLGSQGSVVVSGNKLFTVNAGSNSLSYFDIDPKAPQTPRLARTVNTLGEFPISCAYSPILKKVCVLNGGAKSGVACFDLDGKPDGPLRSIPLNETTPPSGPPGSAGQIGFVGSKIVVTIKGDNSPGSLVVFADQKRVYQNAEIGFDFSFAALDDRTILLTDIVDASVVDIETFEARKVSLSSVAACWVSLDHDVGYISDAGNNNLYKVTDGKLVGTITLQNAGGGVFDSAIAQGYLHALVLADGFVSVNLVTKQQTFLNLSAFGSRQFYIGLAIW